MIQCIHFSCGFALIQYFIIITIIKIINNIACFHTLYEECEAQWARS